MYPTLKAEMARRDVTSAMLADVIERRPATMSAKLNGIAPITLDEAYAIYGYLEAVKPFEAGMTIDKLFEKEAA